MPFTEHRDALVKAIAPFQYPTRDDATLSGDGRVERVGDLLTILVRPTLVELQQECESSAYTHIHILTHGDLDFVGNESYGIVLRADDGSPDVVSGDRFVSAITRLGSSSRGRHHCKLRQRQRRVGRGSRGQLRACGSSSGDPARRGIAVPAEQAWFGAADVASISRAAVG